MRLLVLACACWGGVASASAAPIPAPAIPEEQQLPQEQEEDAVAAGNSEEADASATDEAANIAPRPLIINRVPVEELNASQEPAAAPSHVRDMPSPLVTPEAHPVQADAVAPGDITPAPAEIEHLVGTVPPVVGVSVSQPQPLEGGGFGLLGPENGGFAADVWQRSAPERIAEWLAQVPRGMVHGSVRELLASLLLTNARPPSGPQDGSAYRLGAADDKKFLEARLEALTVIGRQEQALALIDALPKAYRSERIDRMALELRLLSQGIAAACEASREHLTVYDTTLWHGMRLLCQAAGGKWEEVRLGIELMEEQDAKSAPFFRQLLTSIKDAPNDPQRGVTDFPKDFSSAQAAMILAAGKTTLPKNYMAQMPLAAVDAISRREIFSTEIRGVALEKSVTFGMRDVKILQDFYAAMAFDEKELATAATGSLAGVRGRALLYQAAVKEADPEVQARLILRAMPLYRKDGARLLALRLYAPLFQQSLETPRARLSLPELAPIAYDALFLQGGYDAAARWLQRGADKPFQEAMHDALLVLAGQAPPAVEAALTLPLATDRTPVPQLRRLARLKALMAALQMPLRESQTASSASAPQLDAIAPTTPPALLEPFFAAVKTGRKGEAVLLAAIMLEGGDVNRLPDETLAQIVGGLSQIGLQAQARAIAVDAVLAVE